MPPFAIAAADLNDHPDPLRRWEPALEGVYRLKPLFDRERSLGGFLAEQAALPLFWVQLASGAWELDTSGARLELTADAAAARTLPEAHRSTKPTSNSTPPSSNFLRMSAQELQAAAPDTGALAPGEAGPNTQPHTLNILLGARNAQMLQLKQRQAAALRAMLRNMALVMSKPLEEGGFGEPVWVFAKSRGGRLLKRTIVGVDPAEIPSLDIEVRIDPWSQSQRIAIQEHGRARLNDPLDPLDQRAYLRAIHRRRTPRRRPQPLQPMATQPGPPPPPPRRSLGRAAPLRPRGKCPRRAARLRPRGRCPAARRRHASDNDPKSRRDRKSPPPRVQQMHANLAPLEPLADAAFPPEQPA